MTREQFIAGYENWDNYKPLLWEALERTTGDIIEMGIGDGSTKLLHNYAREFDRKLYSYESNLDWYGKYIHLSTVNHQFDWIDVFDDEGWGAAYLRHYKNDNIGLLFIDHAPGERRKVDISWFSNIAQIIVAHDTEPSADHGYQMRAEIAKFKYWRDFETDGAWSSIMSNFIDVTNPL